MSEVPAPKVSGTGTFTPPPPSGIHAKLVEQFKAAGVLVRSETQTLAGVESTSETLMASEAAAPISAGEEQALRNVAYYRGIVRRIGELLGDECKLADDGVLHQDVLAETVLPVLRKRLGLPECPPVFTAGAKFVPPEIAPKHQDNRIEMYVTVYISRPGEKPLQIMTPWIVRDVTEGLDVPGEIYAMVKAGASDIIAHVGKTYLRPNIKGTMKVVD